VNRRQHIAAAAAHIDAVLIRGHGYAYYDAGTCSWWISCADDMAHLSRMLEKARAAKDDDTDIYSLWCADHLAREMPHGYAWISRRVGWTA
jgi:hypothetical protein